MVDTSGLVPGFEIFLAVILGLVLQQGLENFSMISLTFTSLTRFLMLGMPLRDTIVIYEVKAWCCSRKQLSELEVVAL